MTSAEQVAQHKEYLATIKGPQNCLKEIAAFEKHILQRSDKKVLDLSNAYSTPRYANFWVSEQWDGWVSRAWLDPIWAE